MNDVNKNIKDIRAYRTVRSIKSLKLKKGVEINRLHIFLDLYKCDEKTLSKASLLEQKIKKIFNQFNLEPTVKTFYQFEPFGVTAIVCAKGVHFTFHTWPEFKSCAVDLYSFDDRKRATQLCEQIKNVVKSGEYEMKVRRR